MTKTNCPICNEPPRDGWVLYDDPDAAKRKDDARRSVVCARCMPRTAVRVSPFAFALPHRNEGAAMGATGPVGSF